MIHPDKLQDKTLAEWKQQLEDHKIKRPSNYDLEPLRRWNIRKEWIETSITLLEGRERSRWKLVSR